MAENNVIDKGNHTYILLYITTGAINEILESVDILALMPWIGLLSESTVHYLTSCLNKDTENIK